MSKIRLAIIGTQGVPAQYGGFETLVEYLVTYLAKEFDITVFCSSKIYGERISTYNGCRLEYIPIYPNGYQSIFFDFFSILKSLRKCDRILILGVSGGIFFPLLKSFSHKFILNIGGLDWQRSKWSTLTQRFLKLSEKLAILNSRDIVSDNLGIKDYIQNEYKRDSTIIAYGGDQVAFYSYSDNDLAKYPFLNRDYAFSVARIQPDNNIELILDAFINNTVIPIVFVGNWNNSKYGRNIKDYYSKYENVFLLNAIYNRHELDILRSNCKVYIHGHSAGGTNPALVEAMSLGLPVLAYSSIFNINTTQNSALFFATSEELKEKLIIRDQEVYQNIGKCLKNIARTNYTWEIISSKYAEIIKR
ncbi:MAG: DUF1972 domain-containing protein [Bacteroidales bacterium]|nr:DUF1972 domain-containing protein [Bacteroidales bacterium]